MKSIQRGIGCALLGAALLGGALVAQAQSYPNRSVRLLIPFAAGGTTDALGRVVGLMLGERLGQQVVVENRPGGGGTLGADVAAKSTPDGYTAVLASAEAFGMTEAIRKRLAYNPEKDLVPVTLLARSPNAIAVHPSIKATNLKELIEYARANPGKLRFGSPGIGSNPHLIGELFRDRAKIDIVHVPYKGGGNSVIDLVSGQIEMLVTGTVTIVPRHKSGQARALVITGGARTPLMPDVPTMAESGFEDMILGALFGVMVPAGTPREAVDRLSKELVSVSQSAEFRKRLVDIGQEPTEPLTGDAFGRYMSNEARRWRELAVMAGVKDE